MASGLGVRTSAEIRLSAHPSADDPLRHPGSALRSRSPMLISKDTVASSPRKPVLSPVEGARGQGVRSVATAYLPRWDTLGNAPNNHDQPQLQTRGREKTPKIQSNNNNQRLPDLVACCFVACFLK